MITSLFAAALGMLAMSGNGRLVYDAGEPAIGPDDAVAFVNVWSQLDPWDNLCIRIIMPFELSKPTRVTAISVYSFNPKDPADKTIEIYGGTDEQSPGTLIQAVSFPQHSDIQQGWSRFVLPTAIDLPAGHYGIAVHAVREFHTYTAYGAPNGSGYAWVRPNDQIEWFRGGAEDFGFVPNFAFRVYGRNMTAGDASGSPIDGATPVAQRKAKPVIIAEQTAEATPAEGQETGVEGAPLNHEYTPGTRPMTFHTIKRKVQVPTSAEPVPVR